MLLYKYKSLENIWHVLDMVINQRLYCCSWQELNDPLEGRYEIYLGKKSKKIESIMQGRIEEARNALRIASLSKDVTNFLMWSHYANGHKGIAVEVEISEDDPGLYEVTYSPFSSVFTEKEQTGLNMQHLFSAKTEEWTYEEEYRVITSNKHFKLSEPVKRIYLGPQVPRERAVLLKKILPSSCEIVETELDRVQGTLKVLSPNNRFHATDYTGA